MKKLLAILALLAFIFVILAVVQKLPEPVQSWVNDHAGRALPAARKTADEQTNKPFEEAEKAAGEAGN